MEIEHQLHPLFLDLTSQGSDHLQVLTHPFVLVLLFRLLGMYEESHTLGIPSTAFEPRKELNGLTIEIAVHSAIPFIDGKHRDVTS